ncbi:hypothetical protein Pst134EA_011749 [Puccinia striiformis f. sp. tritici]|uniref:hypothetical protein n=1 Tax=Puccinia striiformis f. sp. tritici TaxID=168172 RepID=UPI0020087B02|nr:hypothetical protein Pst134EA_011749 [Puccinia striiformis f. sp. tritici]KAH9468128.1 hypothetical protein Pst134EA_011749 [Puccinia striiformis f. sp. tritici]
MDEGRRQDWTDLDEDHKDFEFAESGLNNDTPIEWQTCGTYQRPVVVFSCTFDPLDPITRQPSLLAWSDVETLFHRNGPPALFHYKRNIITYQEQDVQQISELPSILMEHFLRSSEVLSLFIGLAALDQHFHSDIVAHNPFNSTLEYFKIDHHYSIYPSSTNPDL